MGEADSYTAAADGVRIAWRSDGPADGPAVLLCSMGTAALSVWDPLVDGLAGRWRILRYDRRGDGASDPGSPQSHSFETYARDALGVMDAAGCHAARVVGMALGARVGVRLAIDAPERVLGLVLFDATAGPPASESERQSGSREAAKLRAAAGLPQVAVLPQWFTRRDPAGAGLARHAFTGLPDWTPGLQAISARTLIACGEQDPNFTGAERMARDIPNAGFRPMPMTGHASLLDRPDLVIGLTRGFLEDG